MNIYDPQPILARIETPFCHVLSSAGHLCDHKATWSGHYHGEDSIYTFDPIESRVSWVLVEVCDVHARILWPRIFKERTNA